MENEVDETYGDNLHGTGQQSFEHQFFDPQNVCIPLAAFPTTEKDLPWFSHFLR
jgi:hypothetical protein